MELLTALCFIAFMIIAGPWPYPANVQWWYRGLIVLLLIFFMILGVAHVHPFYGLGGNR